VIRLLHGLLLIQNHDSCARQPDQATDR
jgi:hypothetical protein